MKYIIIIGCGRLGSFIANQMSSQGHSVVVIDKQESAFFALGDEFSGFKIEGDITEILLLEKAKVQRADVVLAVTNDDNLNLMLVQVCKQIYNVPKVIARVEKPEKQQLFEELGVYSICPTEIAGSSFMNYINNEGGKL